MKIIHITDPHVRPLGQSIYGVDSGARLQTVINDVNERHGDADLVAITGDLTHYGEPDAYDRVSALLANLRIPYRLMLGNHDKRPSFRAAFGGHPVDENGFVQSFIDAPGRIGRLLFLDTHEASRIGGHMCELRLAWLKARLREAGSRPVVVFQHHPPLPVSAPHFDNICMASPQPYLDLLRAHPGGVRHIFLGHIHVPLTGVFPGGLPFTAGRGCSHQMVLDFKNPNAPWAAGVPNYNIILLGDDDLYIHNFDLIGAEQIGVAEAPDGP
ncbi:MAG: phosphodiesterase [Hyphomicrobiaceae bacterium]